MTFITHRVASRTYSRRTIPHMVDSASKGLTIVSQSTPPNMASNKEYTARYKEPQNNSKISSSFPRRANSILREVATERKSTPKIYTTNTNNPNVLHTARTEHATAIKKVS